MDKIPLFKPSIGDEELKALSKIFKTGWIGLGPNTYEFEKRFSTYIGTKYSIGLNSATAALDLAFKILQVKGHEVITPSFTFVSTNHAILYNGGVPVFGDIEPDTFCLDPVDVEKKITSRTKAVVTVHYGGHPSKMDELRKICDENNLFLIEDAAHATGASYKDRMVGNLGDIACFSFQALKNLTTGEGGMITTNNEDFYKKLTRLRWMGIDKDTYTRARLKSYSWFYEVKDLGYKNHMHDISASIGMVQLKRLDSYLNLRRRQIADFYNSSFKDIEWITTPVEHQYAKRVYCLYTLLVKERDDFIEHLDANNVSTGVHYYPNHFHPYYVELIRSGIIPKPNTPVTEKTSERIVSLPLYPELSDQQLDHISDTVKSFN